MGREGMTGLPIVLGNHRTPHATYMQAAGEGKCIRATDLRETPSPAKELGVSGSSVTRPTGGEGGVRGGVSRILNALHRCRFPQLYSFVLRFFELAHQSDG